jgi:hypothetical protein
MTAPGRHKRLARVAAVPQVILAPLALVLVTLAAIAASPVTRLRRSRERRPQLVFGPVPVLNIKYIARALTERGYTARTVVHSVYTINDLSDFDVVTARRLRWLPGPEVLRTAVAVLFLDYLTFSACLFRFDVFHCFFDGGFLRRTPLRRLETALLHVAGKRLVVMPYGGDVAIPTAIRSVPWRQGLMEHYPDLGREEARTRRRVEHYCRNADFVLACLVHFETLPRWDLLTTLYYPIDSAEWTSTAPFNDADGVSGPVSILHAPNHRWLKGTHHLEAACEALREEGLHVDLHVISGKKNTEVREAMDRADIIADQFILGFALTALEGMSMARPVLSNLTSHSYYDIHDERTGLSHCPIVRTAPDHLTSTLRELVTNPARRREIGRLGREYVEAAHSFKAVGDMWDRIYDEVWFGNRLTDRAWDPFGAPHSIEAPGG